MTIAPRPAKISGLAPGGPVRRLDPKTPAKEEAAASAPSSFAVIEQTRLLMSLQLAAPSSRHLLTVVVAWATFLFCCFGLLSCLIATTLAAMAHGGFAVASAVFLILELSNPYTGIFRISPAAIEKTIDTIDR